MGSFFLFAFVITAGAQQLGPRAAARRLGGLGLVPGRLRGALHAALHDVPDAPRRALGRHLHRPEVLARPARRGPRRRARGLLHRRADDDRVAGADLRRDRRGRRCGAAAQSYFAAFLVWDFFVSLAVYSWAGEKFAWLVLHPLLPAILLAGVGLQAIWQTRGTLRWVGLVGAAVGAVLRRPLVVVGQRRPRRQPARDARLDPVLDPGQGRRRPGARARREPRPGRAAAERDGRLRRGRDLPLRLVLPPPRRRATSTSSRPTRRRRPPT